MNNEKELGEIEQKINKLVDDFYEIKHKTPEFIPGISMVNVSGKVFDSNELKELIRASLDFWLTDGDFCEEFSNKMSNFMGLKHVSLVNSGSSANLVALSSLTSDKIKNPIKKGSEVVTAAVGFPTTVNPIFQNNLVPVFVDSEIGTYNPTADKIIDACTDETSVIFLAHTLGNPLEISKIKDFANEKNIYIIEDNCDALGSKYDNQLTGTFGNISTLSFYPAHHITMGEGGAVMTNSNSLRRSIESFRDWGRDCWFKSGHDNTCNKRYDWKLGDLPQGYDHKYIYSNIGYNLKATDLQASIGNVQIEKLNDFVEKRKKNWSEINKIILSYDQFFINHKPTENSDPSWFGYAITVKKNKYFDRNTLVKFLNDHRIATRLLFGGNILRQPAYLNMNVKVNGTLDNADKVVDSTFWIGVYPGINQEMIEYVKEVFEKFITTYVK